MPQNNNDIEKRLWSAADELRANSKMRAADYSAPVLGLIFLRYADAKFAQAEKELTEKNNIKILTKVMSKKFNYRVQSMMYIQQEVRSEA